MSQASRFADTRHYDVILSPVITEKATIASEQNKVVFKVAQECDQACRSRRLSKRSVRRQGADAVNTLRAQRQN